MTNPREPVRLVVFDLDGTLIDSIGDIASSANQSLTEAYGDSARLPQDQVRAYVGSGARQLIEKCVDAVGQSKDDVSRVFERFLAIYASRLTETTRLYAGLDDALAVLGASCRLAILTNKPGGMSRTIVNDLDLASRFEAVVGGDDLKTKKPDPEGLLKIAKDLGVPLNEVAMVGDSAVDMATARNAGVMSVGVLWGYDRAGLDREKPDVTVGRTDGLASAILGLRTA